MMKSRIIAEIVKFYLTPYKSKSYLQMHRLILPFEKLSLTTVWLLVVDKLMTYLSFSCETTVSSSEIPLIDPSRPIFCHRIFVLVPDTLHESVG